MSGLDLKSILFLTPSEVATLFRKDCAWVYRNRSGFLRPAAKYFGPKSLLFFKPEIERLITEAPAEAPPKPVARSRKARIYVKTQKRYNGIVPDGPETENTGGAADAKA